MRLRSVQEDAVGRVLNRGPLLVAREFGGEDRLHRLLRFLLSDEVVLRTLHVSQAIPEHRGQSQDAEHQDRDGHHGFDQSEAHLCSRLFRSCLRGDHCWFHTLPLYFHPLTRPVVPSMVMAR